MKKSSLPNKKQLPAVRAVPNHPRTESSRLDAAVADRDALAFHGQESTELTNALKARDAELVAARLRIKTLEAEVQTAREEATRLAAGESAKMIVIQQQTKMITRLHHEIIGFNHQTERLLSLYQSTSWRVTAPLRAFKIRWDRFARGFR
jgi:environmental stress-induced protein Ves